MSQYCSAQFLRLFRSCDSFLPLKSFGDLGVEFLETVGADAVTETGVRSRLDVALDLGPVTLIVAHFLTTRTDRQKAAERLDLGQRVLQVADEPLAFFFGPFALHNLRHPLHEQTQLSFIVFGVWSDFVGHSSNRNDFISIERRRERKRLSEICPGDTPFVWIGRLVVVDHDSLR